MVKYEMMQPKTMQLTTNKMLRAYFKRVETSVGWFFQFFKNRESWFFEYFSESKNCQFRFFGENNSKLKKTPQKPQRNHNFHERICQHPMIFWPVL
jgi:hypothetical protein